MRTQYEESQKLSSKFVSGNFTSLFPAGRLINEQFITMTKSVLLFQNMNLMDVSLREKCTKMHTKY